MRIFTQAGKSWDHPVAQSSYALDLLAEFDRSGRTESIRLATVQADRLLALRIQTRGAWFFPYPFDFPSPAHHLNLHGPWYSAMAQGQALSLFTHLAQNKALPTQQRARYRQAADRTFQSLLLRPDRTQPWVTHLDQDGFLWLEEYPKDPPEQSDRTFNGHIFATYGVWDYYQLTRSPYAARLFDAATTTVAHYAPLLRRAGGISNYCVAHGHPNAKYHQIHITQLHNLALISGDQRFERLSAQFRDDHDAGITGAEASSR
ncbi:hypothetical protein G3I40_27900 [Streptomyces sp. SID14478]|uniref:D-glucuronyl C5-epimerase family protein n=1 Tax=Streptomyces sp. SID14478 TaxID=2706073 RepID=UPI0013DBE5B6|nr:hypothetical protein [Streptomyces sp. SID14478]